VIGSPAHNLACSAGYRPEILTNMGVRFTQADRQQAVVRRLFTELNNHTGQIMVDSDTAAIGDIPGGNGSGKLLRDKFPFTMCRQEKRIVSQDKPKASPGALDRLTAMVHKRGCSAHRF
jgi:hypothetical protein